MCSKKQPCNESGIETFSCGTMGVFVPEHKQCLEITIVPFLPAEQLGGEILSAGGSQVACSEGKMSQCVGDWDRKAELCSATGTREILSQRDKRPRALWSRTWRSQCRLRCLGQS